MTITIIGGGIIGLTTAFELTERGESVHLIDAETGDYLTAEDWQADTMQIFSSVWRRLLRVRTTWFCRLERKQWNISVREG